MKKRREGKLSRDKVQLGRLMGIQKPQDILQSTSGGAFEMENW